MARRGTERGGATNGDSRKGPVLELCAGTGQRLHGLPGHGKCGCRWLSTRSGTTVALTSIARRPPIQILYPPYRLHLHAVRHGRRTARDDAKLVEGGTEPRFVGVQVQSLAGSTNSYPLTGTTLDESAVLHCPEPDVTCPMPPSRPPSGVKRL